MRQYFYFFGGMATVFVATPIFAPQEGWLQPTAYAASPIPYSSSDTPNRAQSQRDDNGLFYLGGKVGKESIRFLVDTGASHVILSHADAGKIEGFSSLADSQKVMTAGGPITVDWIVIKEIAFGGHVIRNLKAAIPRRDVGISLLGQNALAQFDAVHIDGERLTLVK